MAFKKGQSGNPGGRSTEKLIGDQMRLMINEMDKERGKKRLRCLLEKIYGEAMNGEGWAMAQIFDRIDGKPAQESTLTVRRQRATELEDDELADIAVGSGEGTAEAPIDPSQLN